MKKMSLFTAQREMTEALVARAYLLMGHRMKVIEKVHMYGYVLSSERPDGTGMMVGGQQAVNFSGSFLKESDLRTQARQALQLHSFITAHVQSTRVSSWLLGYKVTL